jgi:hypothetical protein
MSKLIKSDKSIEELAIEFKALGGMQAIYNLELGGESSLVHMTYEILADKIDSSEDYDSDITLVNSILEERFNY